MSRPKTVKNLRRYNRRKRQFMRVCEAQNWRCCYCGIRTEWGTDTPRTATREEVVPRSAGGGRAEANTVMACKRCNNTRSSGDAITFYLGVRVGMSMGGSP